MERVLTQDYSMIPSLTLLPVKYEYGGSPCGRIIPHIQPGVKKEAPVTAEASLYFYIHLSYALISCLINPI